MAALVSQALSEDGYDVDVVGSGEQAIDAVREHVYDLVLLDVMLPGLEGWDVLKGLRERQPTPVLFLSALDGVEDRVKGLKLGADDYLVKPFAFSELLARVQNILRRAPAQREQPLRIADLEVDPLRRRVTRSGKRIELTAKEYALLDYFMHHAGEICSRTLIAENVWDMNFDSDTNVVDVAVRRLRAKVDDPFAQKLIHTIRGVGYVFDTQAP
jgi:two-component system copper resistance phosphate regulon response regulator CusR